MLLGGNYKRSSETGPDTTTSLEQRSRDKSQPTGTCKTSTGRSQWVAAWCEQTWVQEGNLGPARTLQITGQAGAQSITKQSANACPSIPFACLVCFFVYCPFGGSANANEARSTEDSRQSPEGLNKADSIYAMRTNKAALLTRACASACC